MRKIRLATVFSGIGAIEFAFQRLGLRPKVVFACDNGEREVQFDVEKAKAALAKCETTKEKAALTETFYSEKSRKPNYMERSYLHNYPWASKTDYYQDIRLINGEDYAGKVDLFVGGSPCQSFSSVGFQKGLEDARGTLFYDYVNLVEKIKPKVFIYENVRGLINHDAGNTWDIIHKIFESTGYHITWGLFN